MRHLKGKTATFKGTRATFDGRACQIVEISKRKEKHSKVLYTQTAIFVHKKSIVIQPHKYTFVIFSASWCAPCHKLIPTYKKIYEAKQDMIDFVYFSLDEAQTQERWKQLLEKEGITWRSLFTDKVDKTRNFYKVPVIPYSFLVYPDGSYKKIDVRQEEDVKLLMDLKL